MNRAALVLVVLDGCRGFRLPAPDAGRRLQLSDAGTSCDDYVHQTSCDRRDSCDSTSTSSCDGDNVMSCDEFSGAISCDECQSEECATVVSRLHITRLAVPSDGDDPPCTQRRRHVWQEPAERYNLRACERGAFPLEARGECCRCTYDNTGFSIINGVSCPNEGTNVMPRRET